MQTSVADKNMYKKSLMYEQFESILEKIPPCWIFFE